MSDRLNAGEQLDSFGKLDSPNGKVSLVMQGDGNLVLIRTSDGKALWASNTDGRPVNRAVMQGDGNFVCYDTSGHARWASNTDNHPGTYLVLQDDGNLVLYQNANAIWATNTAQPWHDIPTGKVIPPQRHNLGEGHFMVSSAELHLETGAVRADVHLTSTNKFSGFHGGVAVSFYDGTGAQIGVERRDFGCAQAPIFGAAHANYTWDLQAPPGTAGYALAQYWHPHWPLPQLFQAMDAFFGDILEVVEGGIDATDQWCAANPDACRAITFAVFVIAATALCVAFPGSCEIALVIVSSA
jgi:hypothetical protein